MNLKKGEIDTSLCHVTSSAGSVSLLWIIGRKLYSLVIQSGMSKHKILKILKMWYTVEGWSIILKEWVEFTHYEVTFPFPVLTCCAVLILPETFEASSHEWVLR